jgi:misacylated tRNA(Ala) deacylase
MATECLFRDDAYLDHCPARVVEIGEHGIVLDRTVFYATSGGQPGDRGILRRGDGAEIPVAGAVYTDPGKTVIAHDALAGTVAPEVGNELEAKIDWELRYRRMRMHTALHLLSAVLPYPVTGGSVGEEESRLDFDIPESGLDKDEITRKLAQMIAAAAPS